MCAFGLFLLIKNLLLSCTILQMVYLFWFQTDEWTSEQRKSYRYPDSSGNEDKLEKYIRHRYRIPNFIEIL